MVAIEDDGRNQTATNGALYRRTSRSALPGAGVATRRRRGTPILREKSVQKSAMLHQYPRRQYKYKYNYTNSVSILYTWPSLLDSELLIEKSC